MHKHKSRKGRDFRPIRINKQVGEKIDAKAQKTAIKHQFTFGESYSDTGRIWYISNVLLNDKRYPPKVIRELPSAQPLRIAASV